MNYLALYRKYRPASFSDLVGQNDISNIIKNEILNNKLSHAYLFSGPRGTGKTSTAKIIAKMVNCSNLDKDGVPCGKCDNCLNSSNNDVVEIDAASNNGVDEIRELRDKVNLVPSSGKYKIYIIDEVHMLTTQAFNALLKTLEEPPAHAIFILATTEFYKIPATVVSRCQKFQFLKFSNDEIVARLSMISKLENISVENDVLYEIARLSDGGLRDAINMLDQLSSFKDGKVEFDDVYKLNGVISYFELSDLLIYIRNNDVNNIINFVNDIDKKGKNIDRFIGDLVEFLKDVLVYKTTSNFNGFTSNKKDKIVAVSNVYSNEAIYNMIISLNDLFIKLKNSSFSSILLVSYFIKMASEFSDICVKKNNGEDVVLIDSCDKKNDSIELISKSISNDKVLFSDTLKKIRINNAFATASKVNKDVFINNWKKVEDVVNNGDYNSIVGIINDVSVLVVGDNNVIFLVKYDSLLDRIYNYVDIFEKLLLSTFEKDYKVVFLANDEWLYEKNRYIKQIKSGYKYEYIDEDNNVNVKKDNENISGDIGDIDKLISIIGNDVISYK